MAKFKVGDRVRILDGSKIENYTGRWNNNMKTHIGEIHVIESIDEDWIGDRVSYCFEDIVFAWDERGLELVNHQKIVITTDGNMTIARLYENEKFVREAVARCAAEDKFDFNVGAALAFQRLTETKKNLDWNKFAHGMISVKVSKEKFPEFMKQCKEKNFTWSNAKDFNPWKSYLELSPLLALLCPIPGDYIYILVQNDSLKWGTTLIEGAEEYEFV